MIFQIGIVTLGLVVLLVLVLVPREIVRSRVEKRLKDLGKKHGGQKISWQEDMDTLCDEHLGKFRLYSLDLARMRRAGYLEHWQTGAFWLAQLGFFVFGLLLAFAGRGLDFQDIASAIKSVLGVVIIVVIFAAIPRLWLHMKTKDNLKKLRKAMPTAVDLMTICMESGNGLEQTFEKVGRELMGTNPQIAMRLLDVRSGMVAYDRKWALEKLERESFFDEEKELARSLLESLRYGTPLVTALRALAQRMREENMNRLEEVAGKASTKMTLPMIVFLLVPVIVIMMAEPIVQFIRGGF
jgi:tight adherence protein C